MEKGYKTHTIDITGRTICLGDIVDYDFKEDDPCPFEVVFEHNAFRKKYKGTANFIPLAPLEFGDHAISMRLKVIS